ncbi:MAG: flagellar hook-basal body complex protein FliE [Pseudomonadota bacterium]
MAMAIDTSRIEAMVAQLRATANRVQGVPNPLESAPASGLGGAVGKPDFASALKMQLDQVSSAQNSASQLGQRFTMGDDSVSLSDVMIASQKANIGFQATIQARNKLVNAYQDIMNMQV